MIPPGAHGQRTMQASIMGGDGPGMRDAPRSFGALALASDGLSGERGGQLGERYEAPRARGVAARLACLEEVTAGLLGATTEEAVAENHPRRGHERPRGELGAAAGPRRGQTRAPGLEGRAARGGRVFAEQSALGVDPDRGRRSQRARRSSSRPARSGPRVIPMRRGGRPARGAPASRCRSSPSGACSAGLVLPSPWTCSSRTRIARSRPRSRANAPSRSIGRASSTPSAGRAPSSQRRRAGSSVVNERWPRSRPRRAPRRWRARRYGEARAAIDATRAALVIPSEDGTQLELLGYAAIPPWADGPRNPFPMPTDGGTAVAFSYRTGERVFLATRAALDGEISRGGLFGERVAGHRALSPAPRPRAGHRGHHVCLRGGGRHRMRRRRALDRRRARRADRRRARSSAASCRVSAEEPHARRHREGLPGRHHAARARRHRAPLEPRGRAGLRLERRGGRRPFRAPDGRGQAGGDAPSPRADRERRGAERGSRRRASTRTGIPSTSPCMPRRSITTTAACNA